MKLVLERESIDDVLYDVPIFDNYMTNTEKGSMKTFGLDEMKCTSIFVWFNQYGLRCYHETANCMEKNIGIQRIYKGYDGKVILIFKKFYLSSIEKIYFGMEIQSKNGFKFENINAYFVK